MNRLFHVIIGGISALLILFFLVLIGSMIAELWQESMVTAPHFDELLFSIKLSLYTATISSIIAIAVSVPVAYFFSRYNFWGKSFFDTLLDLPIVLSPIALGALLLIFFNTPLGEPVERLLGPFIFEVKGIILAQFIVVVGLSISLAVLLR
jgi:molybdate transport system permease protein